VSAKKHTPARRRRAASPKRPSAYTRLIQQRQTEIPRLTAALLASAQAGDRQAQQALQMLAGASLRATLELTAGMNIEAILHLLGLFRESLADFEEQWRSQPQFYQTWAGINDAWPCLLPCRSAERKALIKFVIDKPNPLPPPDKWDKLCLGLDYPLNISGRKSFSTETVGVQVALHLYQLLDGCHLMPESEQRDRLGKIRACLPPLSRQPFDNVTAKKGKPVKGTVAQAWWEAAEPIFIELYGEDFEQHPTFVRYQRHTRFQNLNPTDRRNEIRSTIKADIAQGFNSIAAQ
jgi:hypothetical protein